MATVYLYIILWHECSIWLCQSSVSSREHVNGRQSVHAMGSLPWGIKCAYCGEYDAGYIPDGCVGPLCIGPSWLIPEGRSCFERACVEGWGVVESLRLERLFIKCTAPVCKDFIKTSHTFLARHQLREHVNGFLFGVSVVPKGVSAELRDSTT